MANKRILLIEPGYKNKYPPLGLMKIAQYHGPRGKNDVVKFVKSVDRTLLLEHWDRIYITTLFSFEYPKIAETIDFAVDLVHGQTQRIFVGGIAASLMHEMFLKEPRWRGPATSARMNSLGLQTGLDMRKQTKEFMQANFGRAGEYYYWISRGIDNREVRANRIRKSVGAENTFFSDLTEFEAMLAELEPLIDNVWRHCEDKGVYGRTVTLKVKFADFELISRSRTAVNSLAHRNGLVNVTTELLRGLFPLKKSVRLLGVSISGFVGEEAADSAQTALEF